MDWTAIIPAAVGALIGGSLSFAGGAWQAGRAAARQRQAEVRKRSEDAAAHCMDILHDIRGIAENHPDTVGWPSQFTLSMEGDSLVSTRVLDLERSARLVTNSELRARIKSSAAYLSAPQEFQHLEGEAILTTARHLEMWISDNVSAYLTDAPLPYPPDYVGSYEESYRQACTIAQESWDAQREWHEQELKQQRTDADAENP